ncbi:MAG: peptidase M14 [Tannerella sp.]|nr:peptidase M14 [Tannerella sp.]
MTVADYAFDINYFLPDGKYSFDEAIPQPKDVLGFEVGRQHADWNNVLMYMQALDAASKRVSIKQFGRTNQFRPFIQVAITSEKNQARLDEIRRQHIQLADTKQSGNLKTDDMPVIVNLMYSIHGNEPSGVNSSLVVAYYLAAMKGEKIEQMLDNMVIVLTPGLNPDGINKFASWVNTSRSFPDVSDPNSREFGEPWPSGRTNHYWADCNRDWLMAQHPEGRNALDMYFEWLPNIVCDFHEQGGDRTYYFSPGHPKRTHPLTPRKNQDLTSKMTSYCARSLDQIGTLYYSKERYDDYYFGKGAAYGDIHGSVCILFEQLASRGHLKTTRNYGEMSFPFTIRNQTFSALAIIDGAYENRKELIDYQRDYYKTAESETKKDAVQGYIFNARGSKAIAYHFLENLKYHRIDVYHLANNQTINGKTFNKEDSYVIPINQKYSSMVKTLMENVTQYDDSTFYDISTWTFPHAYNLKYEPVAGVQGLQGLQGVKIENIDFPRGSVIGGVSKVGYLFDNSQYYSARMLAELLRNNLIVKVTSKPFTCPVEGGKINFGRGTMLVMTQNQPVGKDSLYSLVSRLAVECGVDIYSVGSALMQDYDLGTPYFTPLTLPRVAVITGSGMGIPESGEVWMMLGKRFNIPPVMIDYSSLGTANLSKYNVIIMADGQPTRSLTAATTAKIKSWVSAGGLLVATGAAYKWTNSMGLTKIETTLRASAVTNEATKTKPSNRQTYKSYASRSEESSGTSVEGVILNCRLDPTHPLGWGYDQTEIPVFRVGSTAFAKPSSSYAVPLSYLNNPYLSGCISASNIAKIASSPAIITQAEGKGHIIFIADDLNFRMYWYGTTKIFINAVMFGQLL